HRALVPHLGTGAPALYDPQVLPEISGPNSLRHRRTLARAAAPLLLAVPGNLRRVLSLLGKGSPASGAVEHLRHRPTGRGIEEGVPPERAEDHPRCPREAGTLSLGKEVTPGRNGSTGTPTAPSPCNRCRRPFAPNSPGNPSGSRALPTAPRALSGFGRAQTARWRRCR